MLCWTFIFSVFSCCFDSFIILKSAHFWDTSRWLTSFLPSFINTEKAVNLPNFLHFSLNSFICVEPPEACRPRPRATNTRDHLFIWCSWWMSHTHTHTHTVSSLSSAFQHSCSPNSFFKTVFVLKIVSESLSPDVSKLQSSEEEEEKSRSSSVHQLQVHLWSSLHWREDRNLHWFSWTTH